MNGLCFLKGTILSFCLLLFSCAGEKTAFTFLDYSLSIEERVDDLVSRLTPEEKISQLVNNSDSIGRLGIPEYNWWNESLHGVARSGLATQFPQAIGMAATWDTALMFKIATAISDEARAKYHRFQKQGKRNIFQGLTFWSPNINIFRDPRWGRGMETYGEDPYLTGQLAVKYIKGMQGNDKKYLKTVATAKHYVVHSGPEPGRHSFDAVIDERDFKETYLPAFKMSVVDGNVYSVMCAYNRFRGEPCCGSTYLQNQILRDQWGFQGYIVSDCGAVKDFYDGHNVVKTQIEAAALGIKSGTDLNCGDSYQALKEAVDQGLITESEIDVAVKRLFTARFKLGMFDPDEIVPYSKIPYGVVDSEKHRKLALESARKSIVLLKNEGNILPLSKDIKIIAVIGPNANDEEVPLANYFGFPSEIVTPFEGIRAKVPNATVLYASGCNHADNLPAMELVPGNLLFTDANMKEHGLKGEYFNDRDFNGNPMHNRIDTALNFCWWENAPFEDMDDDNFAVRWSGFFVPPVSGEIFFGVEARQDMKLYLNDSLIISFFEADTPRKRYRKIRVEAGEPYKIKMEYREKHGDALVRLIWNKPDGDLKSKAIEVARKADVVLMFMGLTPRLEGEEMEVDAPGFRGGDRLTLDLPAIQTDLMKALVALGKPVILVLESGSAVSINWANQNIPAILQAWYPGQAGGTAIADVLFGDYNPAGRLPVTYYKSVDELPAFSDYAMKGRTYRYFTGEPLYEFGYGLSYTTFAYKNLVVPEKVVVNSPVSVSVEVENTGKYDGEEVVQLYISRKNASVPVPIRSLAGFQRVFLKTGETVHVQFNVNPEQLSVINNEGKQVVEPGNIVFAVGGKQPDEVALSKGFALQKRMNLNP